MHWVEEHPTNKGSSSALGRRDMDSQHSSESLMLSLTWHASKQKVNGINT